jgi:hypothetical protein
LAHGSSFTLTDIMNSSRTKNLAASRVELLTGAVLAACATTAVWVEVQARRAEREHAPAGQFVDVDGARLHYVERGEGPPVVLIHGNAVSPSYFKASGLIDTLAIDHRMIAIDRPALATALVRATACGRRAP